MVRSRDANYHAKQKRALSNWRNCAVFTPPLTTQAAPTRDDAISCLKYGVPDVILMDVCMEGCAPKSFLQAVSSIFPPPKIVLISAYPTEMKRYENDVDGCIEKPIDPDDLKAYLANLAPEPTPVR